MGLIVTKAYCIAQSEFLQRRSFSNRKLAYREDNQKGDLFSRIFLGNSGLI